MKKPQIKKPIDKHRTEYSFLDQLCEEAVEGDFRNAVQMAALFVKRPGRAAYVIDRLKRERIERSEVR